MDMQKFLDGVSAAMRKTREDYHMTLGAVIAALDGADKDMPVVLSDDTTRGPGKARSYRGYYSDLAFSPERPTTVGAFLEACRSALGKTFEGYKGGDFVMDESTPLWIAPYGESTDRAIIGSSIVNGTFVLLIKQID